MKNEFIFPEVYYECVIVGASYKESNYSVLRFIMSVNCRRKLQGMELCYLQVYYECVL